MATNILASVSVVLGAEISEFKAKMAEARKELSGLLKFGEGAKDIGGDLSKFLTVPLLALGGAGVKMAGDLEKATASFTTLLGSAEAAGQTLNELKQFAADTPFEFPEIQDAAKKLLAFNTPAKELKETLRQLGDISAGIDAPIGEIAELFGKARVQGRLFQEDINQLTGRGIPIIQELAKQFGVTESGVRKLVESGKVNFGNLQTAFADLTKEGGKFGGLMEKQSQTLPGLFSSLKDNVGQSLSGLGTDLIAALDLKGVVREIGDFVKSAADAFAGLSPEVKKFIFIGAGLAAALGPVLFGLGSLITLLPALQAGFAVLGVSSLAALGPLLVPIGAIAAGAVLIYENWDQLRPVFASAAESIGAAIGQIRDALASVGLGSTMGDLIKGLDLGKRLVSDLAVGVQALADIFGGTIGAITALFNGDFKTALSEAERALVGLVSPLANVLGFSKKTTFDDFFHLREAVIAVDEAAGAAALSGGDLAAALEAESKAVATLTEEQLKALQKLQEALRLNERLSIALGDSYDYIKGKQSALESGIKSLVSAGFDPAGRTVQQFVAQLRAIPEAYDQVAGRMATGLKAPELPEFKLQMPDALDFPQLPQQLSNGLNIGQLIGLDKLRTQAQELDAIYLGMSETQRAALTRQTDFNTGMGALIDSLNTNVGPLLAGFANQFGEAFGSIVAGTASAGDALTQLFSGITSALASFMSTFGQQLIAIGIGKLSLDAIFSGPQGGPLAIAAGLGLVALAGVVKAVSSSASSSLGSIGNGGGGGSTASTRPSFTPTTAPSAAAAGPSVYTHHVVIKADGNDLRNTLSLSTDRFGRITGR
jgi:tape measure domain-containing protein